jgi:hypothetical protein
VEGEYTPRRKAVKDKTGALARNSLCEVGFVRLLFIKEEVMPIVKIPEGYQRIMPYLIVKDALTFLQFMKKVFGAEEN